MKKFYNCLLIILVLLGMTGCGNPAGGESDLDSQPVIQLGDCELTVIENNSIEIALPEQIPDRANKILVYRKAASDENWGSSWYMYKNARHGTDLLIDKYLEANKEYVYKMEMIDGWDRIIAVSNPTTIKAPEEGKGELILNEENIEVKYDEKIGVLTFNSPLKFANTENPLSYCANSAKYVAENGTRVFEGFTEENQTTAEENQTTIDMTKTVWDDRFYGKPLNLAGLYCFGKQGEIYYKVGINNLADKISEEKVPAQITIPDLRPEVTVTSTNEGLKIEFPLMNEAQKTKITRSDAVWIFRTDENGNGLGYIKSTDKNISTVDDPYVEEGHSYKYDVQWRKGEDKLFIAKTSSLVKSEKGGSGNLLFDKNTQVNYDNFTGVMKLEPKQLKENVTAKLTYRNSETDDPITATMNENCEFNFKDAISKNNVPNRFYNNDLEFSNLEITSTKDSIIYGIYIDQNERMKYISGIPAIINVKLPVTAKKDGIHIPIESNSKADYITIYRNRGKDDRYRISFNPKIDNVLLNNEIIDEYVNKDKEYTYEVEYKEGKTLLKKVEFNPVIAIGGSGELILTENPKVAFQDGLLRVDSLGKTKAGFKVSLKYTDWESIFYNIDKIKVYDMTSKYPGKKLNAFIEITTDGDQNLHRTQNIATPEGIPAVITISEKHEMQHIEIPLMGQNIWKIDGTNGKYATIQVTEGNYKTGNMTVLFFGFKDKEPDDGIIDGVGEGTYEITTNGLIYNPPENNKGNGPQPITFIDVLNEDCIKIETSAFNILYSETGAPKQLEMHRQI